MTQREMILDHLRKYGDITSVEAVNRYGISRLSARIKDLRDEGKVIISQRQKSRNRWGKTVFYDKYVLGGADEGQHNDVQITV